MSNNAKTVGIIGAAIMDIMGFPNGQLVSYDSVPGHLKSAPGGVGRNIAENLSRLAIPTQLITAFGDDIFAHALQRQTKGAGVNISHSIVLQNARGATHLAIQDHNNDMATGIADLAIFEHLTPQNLSAVLPFLQQLPTIIIECNIPAATIEWLSQSLPTSVLIVDPVSAPLCLKMQKIAENFDILKANRQEAEILSEMNLQEEGDLQRAASFFHKKGIQKVFITLGAEGAFCSDGQTSKWIKSRPERAVNTTGAGDGFMAGMVYGMQQKCPIEVCTQMGMAAAQIAIRHEKAVNPNLNPLILQHELERL